LKIITTAIEANATSNSLQKPRVMLT